MTNDELALETKIAGALGLDPPDPARDLCRSLILAEPTSPYREVQATAERLGLTVSRTLFQAVHREIAGTARGPEVPEREPVPNETPADPALHEMRRGTSALDFMVQHLTTHPSATYADVRSAAIAAGHAVLPITYGRARKLAGLSSRSKPGQPGIDGRPTPNPAMAFLVEILRTHPESTYREVKAAAAGAGHAIFPVTFGNARRIAGLARRGPKPAAQKRTRIPAPTPPPIPAARPVKRTTTKTPSTSGDAITAFAEFAASLEGNRELLREAMGKIAEIAGECLDELE